MRKMYIFFLGAVLAFIRYWASGTYLLPSISFVPVLVMNPGQAMQLFKGIQILGYIVIFVITLFSMF